MFNRKVKNLIFILISIFLIIIHSYHIVKIQKTSLETVEFYLTEYNNKNIGLMNSVLLEEDKSTRYEIDNLNYLKIISIENADRELLDIFKPPSPFLLQHNIDVSELEIIEATFEINYIEDMPNAGFDNGIYHWYFVLVKNSRFPQWTIIVKGQ